LLKAKVAIFTTKDTDEDNIMRKFTLILLTVLMSAMLTFAQTTGRIVGTVVAPDGALIPGASVVVTDNQTGRQRTIVASDEGTFDVSQLEFGTYTVTITATGYKTFTTPDVKIDAGREYSLRAQLEVGQVSEQVTVTAGAEQINASNGELSNTVSPQQIRELPLNGRNPLSLISLQAGASATTGSVNGQRTSSTNVTRDGLVVQDVFIRSGRFVADQPTVDDTGEFTLITQNAGSEVGGGSTQVQLVTPRGGSEFHGSLYAFNRNSEFTANRFFSNFNGLSRPFLNRNQFGGTISGPAPIFNFGEGGPAFLKNKAFFFFNYEGFRLAQQVSASGTTLLPVAQNGTFTYLDASNVQRTVNVLTGAGFTAPIPAAQGGALSVSPVIQSRILSQLPSNCTGTVTGINLTQVCNFNRGDPEERNSYAARFDVDVTDRSSLNFVYKRNNIVDARTDIAAGFSPNVFVNQGGPTNFFVGAYRWTPTSKFSNEVRAGFNYSEPFFGGIGNLPQDYLLGNLQLITSPEASFFDQGRNTLYKTIQDNAVYSTGNHSIRFGGQLEVYKVEAVNFAGVVPTFNILGSAGNVVAPRLDASLFPGGINATDRSRADALRFLLAGIIGGGSVNANLLDTTSGFQLGAPAIRNLNYNQYAAYVSDQWRVRPNLTLNLGLRYELYTPLNDPKGLYLEPVVTNFDNPVQDLLSPNGTYNFVGTNAGKKGDFHKADKNNFGPNISFAYTPKFETGLFSKVLGGGTVIRGGFRVNFSNDEYIRSSDNAMLNNQGLGTTTVSARDAAGLTTLRSSVSPVAGFDALPTFIAPAMRTVPFTYASNNTAAFSNFGTVSLLDPNLQVPKSYEYNLGIQRNIGFGSVIEIRYVGNRSDELIRSIDYNQLNIRDTGFLADFQRAQQNCRLQGATLANPTGDTRDPLFRCTNAAFNPAIAGSQPLPVFSQLVSGGLLNNATILASIQGGTPGTLAETYVINNLEGPVGFLANPNTGVANFTTNGGQQRYNALQIEVRRRFSRGFSFQANYSFAKTLADIVDDSQTRVNPFLDNANPRLDYGRPDYDRTHVFNFNSVMELPFGKGKRFLNQGGVINTIFGGFQLSTILQMSSGAPIGVLDPRGTLNRGGRSGRQSAMSNLSGDQLKDLMGVFKTPNGVFFINPSVLFATAQQFTAAGVAIPGTARTVDLTQTLDPGFRVTSVRGAAPIDQPAFAGQVFFFNRPGETGNLGRNFANGPKYINLNLNLSKNFRFTESMRLQIRGELFNVLNRPNFAIGDFDITSTQFGRIGATFDQRIVQFGARFDF
jgi:hypothetical protein